MAAQNSPPRQPLRPSQAAQQQRPWGQPQPQAKPWGLAQPEQYPWDQQQPQQHPWGQAPSQKGDKVSHWGQGRSQAMGGNSQWGQGPSQTSGQNIPRRPQAGSGNAAWGPAQSQGYSGAVPATAGRDAEGWVDAVPVLSAESSASMVSWLLQSRPTHYLSSCIRGTLKHWIYSTREIASWKLVIRWRAMTDEAALPLC